MDTLKAFLSNGAVLITLGAILFIALFLYLFFRFKDFFENRRYILMEMERSGKKGKRYYKYQLKKLYVSQIPLIGGFLCRFIKKK